MLDGAVADVVEAQRLGVLGALVAHGADQPRAAVAGQREERQEIGVVEVDMQFAIDRRPRRGSRGGADRPTRSDRDAPAEGGAAPAEATASTGTTTATTGSTPGEA